MLASIIVDIAFVERFGHVGRASLFFVAFLLKFFAGVGYKNFVH